MRPAAREVAHEGIADLAKIGRDEPVKIPDHATDCLRYLVMTRTVDELGGMEAWQRRERQRKEARL